MEKILGSKTRKAAIIVLTFFTFFLLTACSTSDAKDIYGFNGDTIETQKNDVTIRAESEVTKSDVVISNDFDEDFEEEFESEKTPVHESENEETKSQENDSANQEEIVIPVEEETEEKENSTQELEIIDVEETNEEEENNERFIDKEGKMVAITFDDGPSAKYTQVILEILKSHNVLATFFELGYLAEDYPELILAEYEAGHEIGNHSFTHINMKTSSYEKVISEINNTNDVIEEITGVRPIYLRPPYGNLNKEALSDSGMHVILWSVDTRDWESKSEEKIMEVIKEKSNLDGHVILMHSTQKATANVLDELLTYLEENGYQCVTLSELFEYKYNVEPEEGKTYGYTFFHSAQNKQ